MISDQEILDFYREVIVPRYFKDSPCYINRRELDDRLNYLKKAIRDELLNIGVEEFRISFSFDGKNLNINIIPESEIQRPNFNFELKFKL